MVDFEDMRKQRDSLLYRVEQLKDRISDLRDVIVNVYRDPADAKKLTKEELDEWQEP